MNKRIGGKRAAVAMSGGVDSSVAAVLLKQQGYEVVAVTAKMTNSPAADAIISNARSVADKLNIEHHVADVVSEFQTLVIDYFNRAYTEGKTPNPCAVCNYTVKWGALFDFAMKNLGADVFATGHYAKIVADNGVYKFYPTKDPRKDQLYFLFSLTQEQLARTVFPLCELDKSEVRQIAQEYDLPSKSAKDSQDICFIAKPKTLREYLGETLGVQKGDFIEIETGKKLGEHDGCFHFTIGQRRGIGIAHEVPLYVIKIDAASNTVFLGEKHQALRQELELVNVSRAYPFPEILNKHPSPLSSPRSENLGSCAALEVLTKIRYNMPFVRAKVLFSGENRAKMIFDEPVYSVTPGQAAVWYDLSDGHLLGGGWIV